MDQSRVVRVWGPGSPVPPYGYNEHKSNTLPSALEWWSIQSGLDDQVGRNGFQAHTAGVYTPLMFAGQYVASSLVLGPQHKPGVPGSSL